MDFIADFTKRFDGCVDEYETLITDNRIWKQRTVDIGVVTEERALNLGFLVQCCVVQASLGIYKNNLYDVYAKMDFDIRLVKVAIVM